jgi:short-subunit dehydrogenase
MLINVAGLSPHPKSWQEQTGDMVVETFRVMAIRHFLPGLERASDARVVNISSAFGSISGGLMLTD